jgi:tetratricopeptide (TPR) repeat protein
VHGSVNSPEELISELSKMNDMSPIGIEQRNKEIIEEYLEHVRQNIKIVSTRITTFREQYHKDIEKWIGEGLEEWCTQKEDKMKQRHDKTAGRDKMSRLIIQPQDAYYFLSMLKEFTEPNKEYDRTRYEKFRTPFENVYKDAVIEMDFGRGQVSTTLNRLLYYLFERASSQGVEKSKGKLLYQYGAYDTDLDLMLEDYFLHKNIFAEPITSNDYEKMLLYRRVGLSLMTIGRLNDSEMLYERSQDIASKNKEWSIDLAKILQLKSELYIHQGRLTDSATSVNDAISFYENEVEGEYCSTGDEMWGVQNVAMGPIQLIVCCLAYQAWTLHLSGLGNEAGITFEKAEKIARDINPASRPGNKRYLNRPKPMYHLRDL